MGIKPIRKYFWWLVLPVILSVIIGGVTLAYANAPDTPTLTVGIITDTTVELSWTQTSSNHNTDVFMCEGVACNPTTQEGNNEDSPYNVTALTPNTLYRFQVSETHGQNTELSNIVEATTTGGPPPSGETSPPINFIATQVGQSIRLQWDYHPDDTSDPEKIVISRQELGENNFKKLAKEKDHKETIKNKKGGLVTDFYLDTETGANPGPPVVGTTYRYEIDVKYVNNDKQIAESNFIRLDHAEGIVMSGGGHAIENPTGGFTFPPFLIGFLAFADANFLAETSPNPQNESFLFAIEPIPIPVGLDEGCDEILEILHHVSVINSDVDVRATIIENNATGSFAQHQTILDLSNSDKRHFSRHFFIAFEDQVIQNYEDLTVQLDFTQRTGSPTQVHIHDLNFYVPQDRSSC